LQEVYQRSSSDYSLFILNPYSEFTSLLVCVDDIKVVGTSMIEINKIKFIFEC